MESKICRVCLDKTATISVFEMNDEIQYCVKIMRCVNVCIEEGDGLPDSICENCASDLSVAYEFGQKCEASDKALRCLEIIQKPESDVKKEDYKDIKEEIKLELDYCALNEATESYLIDNHINEDEEPVRKKKYKKKNKDKISKMTSDLGPLQCMICGLITNCQSAMERHQRTHTGEKPFSCDVCSKNYKCKSTLKTHMLVHYPELKEKEELESANMFDRRRNKSKKSPMQCIICGLLCICRSALENHMRTHTGEKPFACKFCDARYNLKGSLKRHIEVYHETRERKFTCETCGNRFYRKNDIITHMRVHTDERPYSCSFCSMRFRQVASLIRHKRVHTGERPYSCPICNKAFSDKSLVTKHLSVHSDEKKYSCHLCNKSVKSKNALNIHLKLHLNEKHYICSYCGMTFSYKGNLKTHVRRIHSERSGECTICMKTFPDLDVHMRKHTGEKPFACKLCNRGFATQRSLSHHIAFKHENASKFKCSIGECTKTFPAAPMLEFHLLKQHANHTPHVCHHCSRGYFRMSDLSRHLKVSHMETQEKIKLQTQTT